MSHGTALQKVNAQIAQRHLLSILEPFLIQLAYRKLNENTYIYRFRTAKERNAQVYKCSAESIYQSKLCAAIKSLRRIKEKVSNDPVLY